MQDEAVEPILDTQSVYISLVTEKCLLEKNLKILHEFGFFLNKQIYFATGF